jgi:hypothetical protein
MISVMTFSGRNKRWVIKSNNMTPVVGEKMIRSWDLYRLSQALPYSCCSSALPEWDKHTGRKENGTINRLLYSPQGSTILYSKMLFAFYFDTSANCYVPFAWLI